MQPFFVHCVSYSPSRHPQADPVLKWKAIGSPRGRWNQVSTPATSSLPQSSWTFATLPEWCLQGELSPSLTPCTLFPPWINGFIYKSLDIHVDRANSGPSVKDAPECIGTNLWLDWIALQSVAYQTGGFDVFITVERKSYDSAISFPVFLQRDTFVYSFLLLRNVNMPDLNVNGEDITSYF